MFAGVQAVTSGLRAYGYTGRASDAKYDAPWQDFYLQSKALRQYNFDLFFNKDKLSEEINKTVNLFLEFADSSKISS